MMKRIFVPSPALLPCHTAALELARHVRAPLAAESAPATLQPGDVVLAVGDEIEAWPAMAAKVSTEARAGEWELVTEVDGAWIFAGSSPRNVCRAVLSWMAHPARETNRLSRFPVRERFTMWDNSMNQMYRFGRGFDRRQHVREIARLGFNGVEVNRYADSGHHVRHRRFSKDSYAWYMSYAPALDAFVTSDLTREFYEADELKRNLDDLREAVQFAREFGLQPGFVCYEPRGVSEAIFE